MRVTDPEDIALMMKTADAVKQKAYGDRIVLTAPLHISNHCGSECLYCANRKSNTLIQRKYMTSPEMREAAGKLIRQGHKRIVLVSGQLPNADVEYLAEAISIMYTVFDGHGEVRRVNVNVGPLNADQYSVLLDADVGNVLIYQDTYHPDYYKAAHVAGPKSHYEKRLNAPEVALGAGVRDVGLGLLLGLAPWQFDVLATMLHVAHLNRLFGAGGHTISMFRLRPAPGSLFVPPHPLSDDEFLRCVAIMRLAVPHAGIVVTTREPACGVTPVAAVSPRCSRAAWAALTRHGATSPVPTASPSRWAKTPTWTKWCASSWKRPSTCPRSVPPVPAWAAAVRTSWAWCTSAACAASAAPTPSLPSKSSCSITRRPIPVRWANA